MTRQRGTEVQLALMILTRLPVGRLREPAPGLTDAAWAFPLVGVVIGALGWGALSVAGAIGLEPLAAALVAIGAMVWATGALHVDGLADFADGIGGGQNRDHCLEIMRDSRIGSYGVVTLILVIALQAASISDIADDAGLVLFTIVGVVSRLAMLTLLLWLPPARQDGLGASATVTSPGALVPGVVVTVALVMWGGWQGVAVLGAAGLVTALVARLAWRRIRGQTGDVLGAAQLTAETAGWIAAAAVLS